MLSCGRVDVHACVDLGPTCFISVCTCMRACMCDFMSERVYA